MDMNNVLDVLATNSKDVLKVECVGPNFPRFLHQLKARKTGRVESS